MKKQAQNTQTSKKSMILGAVVLASIAGAYFFYGSKHSAKNRKQVRGWMVKAKGEIIEKLEKAKTEGEEEYNTIVDSVLRKYRAIKAIDTNEVDALGRDLKKHWKAFQKELKKVKKS